MIGIDKLYHFVACFMATIVVGVIIGVSSGVLFALGLAIGKEYGDHKAKGNHWCWYDILADVLGIIAAGLIIWMIL